MQTEKMLQAAEEIVGSYLWGHYDLLVLPPSFPYGGMENPTLTFVSPTTLVSIVNLIIMPNFWWVNMLLMTSPDQVLLH